MQVPVRLYKHNSVLFQLVNKIPMMTKSGKSFLSW